MTISKCQLDMQIRLERCEFIADEADVSPKVASDHHTPQPKQIISFSVPGVKKKLNTSNTKKNAIFKKLLKKSSTLHLNQVRVITEK